MDIGDALKSIVPGLATALGGPLAGVAASFIADKLGVQEKTVKAVSDAIQGDKLGPDQVVALKQAEIAYQEFLKTNEIDMEKVYAGDRDSARKREIEAKDRTPAILAYLITLGFFGVLAYLVAYGKPQMGGDALLVLLGSLGTAWASVCGYYFGSSAGSTQKNDALVKLAGK